LAHKVELAPYHAAYHAAYHTAHRAARRRAGLARYYARKKGGEVGHT
jgi:hypothetical protein